ncbi:beta-ureidopropionase isoform X2 [Harmonia axyridis]|uniref:beta-ureidopropionase isoform X2 n=1 Tax=Harmonia axyridis TaxID=115357 RepID=UPI001E27708E|nr:beta-ureidopropionase isoform X2 [Harmonia axyridis]
MYNKAYQRREPQLKVGLSCRFFSTDDDKEITCTMSNLMEEFESVEALLKKLPPDDYKKLKNVLFGTETYELPLSENVSKMAENYNFDVLSCKFSCEKEELRPPRIVRVGIFQNKIPMCPETPIVKQREAVHRMAKDAIRTAAAGGVNIFCFQETWSKFSYMIEARLFEQKCRDMPFAFCTKEKLPWTEYAENAKHGPSTLFLSELAKMYNMVIVSNILERDETHGDTIWNAAVFIDNHGDYLGKHRKNHIPRVGDFNESSYYFEGNTGHPVFDTEFGKIAANICYGRHHPLNWMMFALNGAEIVFNPSATIGDLSEPLWGIEARCNAIANGYFTCAINRVGTEIFPREFCSGDKKPAHRNFGHFYGSSYVTAPNGSRSPGLSRVRNGLLIAELDLNLCRQVRDKWGFRMTQRLEMYSQCLNKAIQPDFVPQVIRK